jgi:hypothetical protein
MIDGAASFIFLGAFRSFWVGGIVILLLRCAAINGSRNGNRRCYCTDGWLINSVDRCRGAILVLGTQSWWFVAIVESPAGIGRFCLESTHSSGSKVELKNRNIHSYSLLPASCNDGRLRKELSFSPNLTHKERKIKGNPFSPSSHFLNFKMQSFTGSRSTEGGRCALATPHPSP